MLTELSIMVVAIGTFAGAGGLHADTTSLQASLDQAEMCLTEAIEASANPAECLMKIHSPCLAYSQAAAPQASLCYVEMRKGWDAKIKAMLEAASASEDARLAASFRIESKYELLANLLNCDRLDELAELYKQPETERILQKTRCEATASAVTFIKLFVGAEAEK
ncbi:hypothetical protein ACSBLW_14510 [Thioclava sp. FR2]|uniref:hypothetical protein n=1 Tax=Thioclava sp. FR2 TaxID=3445780 RepID=UPI003EBFA3F4